MSNQEESAPTPPVDRHDGFSQGPRAWWALWTKLVQWGVGNPWIVWSLVAVNLISSAAGYVYWYGDSILAAPPYFWPFVPDSPLSANLWAVALVAFHRSRQWNLLGLLAATGAIKYGLWTVSYPHLRAHETKANLV